MQVRSVPPLTNMYNNGFDNVSVFRGGELFDGWICGLKSVLLALSPATRPNTVSSSNCILFLTGLVLEYGRLFQSQYVGWYLTVKCLPTMSSPLPSVRNEDFWIFGYG